MKGKTLQESHYLPSHVKNTTISRLQTKTGKKVNEAIISQVSLVDNSAVDKSGLNPEEQCELFTYTVCAVSYCHHPQKPWKGCKDHFDYNHCVVQNIMHCRLHIPGGMANSSGNLWKFKTMHFKVS